MALSQREPGRIPRGAEQAAMSEFTSRTKGNILSREVTLGHIPPRGNKENRNFPLIPKGMIKAPSQDVKNTF
jgi:hypothetical protein